MYHVFNEAEMYHVFNMGKVGMVLLPWLPPNQALLIKKDLRLVLAFVGEFHATARLPS